MRGALLPLADDVRGPTWKPRGFFATFHPAYIGRGGNEEEPAEEGKDGRAIDLLYYFFLYDLVKARTMSEGTAVEWADSCDLFVSAADGLRRVQLDENEKPVL